MMTLMLFWAKSDDGQHYPLWLDPRNIEQIEPLGETHSLVHLRGESYTTGGEEVFGQGADLTSWLARPSSFPRPTPQRHQRHGYDINGYVKPADAPEKSGTLIYQSEMEGNDA